MKRVKIIHTKQVATEEIFNIQITIQACRYVSFICTYVSYEMWKSIQMLFLLSTAISPLNSHRIYSMMYHNSAVSIIAIRSGRMFQRKR